MMLWVVVFLGTGSLVAQVDPFCWSHAGVFLFHHDMECDEAAVVEYIKGRVVLMIMDSGVFFNLTDHSVAHVVYPVKPLSCARSSC